MEEIKLTEDQEKALAELEKPGNVFLTGEAGTGKSFVIAEYIKRHPKECIVCAPTGIAAINAKGCTLHRMFKIPIHPITPDEWNFTPAAAIIKAKTIIIDEISMCRFDVFNYVINTINEAEDRSEPKKIIVVGDFFQLSPVITPKDLNILANYWPDDHLADGFAFHTEAWKYCKFKTVFLREIVRQDAEEFQQNLNRIRIGDVSSIPWFNFNCSKVKQDNAIYLCGTNAKAAQVNETEAAKLDTPIHIFTATIDGQVNESDKVTEEVLALKVGMQVMTLVNDPSGGYQNGTLGTIISIGDDWVRIRKQNNSEVTVTNYEWEVYSYKVNDKKELEKVVIGTYKQIPLKIAYAVTIHKSQGQTYEKANIDPQCFATGQLYVALSRVKNINNMFLTQPIRPYFLKAAPEVIKFYQDYI